MTEIYHHYFLSVILLIRTNKKHLTYYLRQNKGRITYYLKQMFIFVFVNQYKNNYVSTNSSARTPKME